MPDRAVCTFAEGEMLTLQKMAKPALLEFAVTHGYTPCLPRAYALRNIASYEPWLDSGRPASWLKLIFMYNLLGFHDEVLWLDADVFVRDPSRDPAVGIPESCSMAMVMHHTDQGFVPNCGVWMVRRSARELLLELWRMAAHRDGGWWEQSALIERLGLYRRGGRFAVPSQPNALFRGVHWLDPGFNAVPTHANWPTARPRFLHASGVPMEERVRHMGRWSGGAL